MVVLFTFNLQTKFKIHPLQRYGHGPSGGGSGGQGGACAPGGTVQGRHLEGRKYGILKSGHFWRIGVHIAERIWREVCIT